MNRLYQIKGYKEIDGYICPITELCKDSDELMHVFLMSLNDKIGYWYSAYALSMPIDTDKTLAST
jgi:hypothetical protein